MAPLAVWWLTHGIKWQTPTCLCRSTYLHNIVSVDTSPLRPTESPVTAITSTTKTTTTALPTCWYPTQSVSKSYKNISGNMGVQFHFRGGNIIRSLTVAPKCKDNITQKYGVIYRYRCDRLECDEAYIGESAQTFEERLRNISGFLPPSMTMQTPQIIISGKTTSLLWVGSHTMLWGPPGSMYIRVNNPFLKKHWEVSFVQHLGSGQFITSDFQLK